MVKLDKKVLERFIQLLEDDPKIDNTIINNISDKLLEASGYVDEKQKTKERNNQRKNKSSKYEDY